MICSFRPDVPFDGPDQADQELTCFRVFVCSFPPSKSSLFTGRRLSHIPNWPFLEGGSNTWFHGDCKNHNVGLKQSTHINKQTNTKKCTSKQTINHINQHTKQTHKYTQNNLKTRTIKQTDKQTIKHTHTKTTNNQPKNQTNK